jgi:transcriptional regulator with XRE-family HTH domain
MDERTTPLTVLGARLRAARKARGMTQDQVAQPEFTKSYVSAVERGTARPSLKALKLMAQRLDLPLNELLALPVETSAPDLPALATEVDQALNESAVLLYQQQAATVLDRLAALEAAQQETLPQLVWTFTYRLHLLRGKAYLCQRQASSAREAAQTALALADEHGAPEATVVARDLLGQSFQLEGAIRAALEQHEQCLRAIHTGEVHDPHLRLRIYEHLIAEYQTLHQPDQVEAILREAQDLLNARAILPGLAALYAAGAQATEEGNPEQARRYITQALSTSAIAETFNSGATLQITRAGHLIDQRQYAEAEALLVQAGRRLAVIGHAYLPLQLAAQQTRLEIARGNLDRAAALAQAGIAAGEQTLSDQATADPALQTAVRAVVIRLLQLAGTLAEQRGRSQEADRFFEQAIGLLDAGVGPLGAEVEANYAELLLARGDHVGATRHYQAATRYARHR